MRITVLMSCFNAAQWVERSIESVLLQTYRQFEFLIIDDGSTDATAEIVEKYQSRDSRILLTRKDNTGLADSLNVGLRLAQGTWIARLDADDTCRPDRLERQLTSATERGTSVVFVGSGMHEIDASSNVLRTHHYPERARLIVKNMRSARKYPPHSSAFFLRSAALQMGGYRPRIRRSQDLDLWLRLSEVGDLSCLHEPLVSIRQHPGQVSHEDSGRRTLVDATVAMVSYHLRRLGTPDPVNGSDEVFSEFRQWVEDRVRELKVIEQRRYTTEFRRRYLGAPSATSRLLALCNSLIAEPTFLARIAGAKLFGSRTPVRLAHEWRRKLSR